MDPVARHHRHERPGWFEERGPIFQRAMAEFVAQLAGKPGVSRVLLIGSVARGELRPADLDLAVILANVEEAVPHVSLASRRLSQITHLTDVFVFDAGENYVGRICQRSPLNCPTRSVECIPGCGAIKCLKIVPGFLARPDILVGARLLWPHEELSPPKAVSGEPNNVFLIGQAGVGKTSLGKIVAERLKRHFFDLDEEVERFYRKSLDELRRDFLGVHSYRTAKIDVLLSFSKDARNAVIAVSSDCARERRGWKLMRDKGVIIHLYADPIEVNERCPIYVGGRELSAEEKKGMHKRLAREAKSLFNYHRPFYERANHTLDITGLGMEAAVQQLCDLISRVASERRGEWDATRVP